VEVVEEGEVPAKEAVEVMVVALVETINKP